MIEPLNLQVILVNYLAGSMVIFYFLILGFFAYLGARFRMPNQVFLILMAVFTIMMAGYGLEPMAVIVIILSGIFIYYAFSEITS